MQRNIFNRISFLTIIIGILMFFSIGDAFALTISPPIKEFTADPGTEFSDVIKLINEEDTEKVFFATIEGFKARGEKGEAEFFLTTDETQLATWFTLEQTSVTLKPREKKEVRFTVKVPAKASTGGQYAAIFWSSQSPEISGTGLGLVTKIGSLFLVTVSGAVKEEMKLVEFSTSRTYYNRLPVEFIIGFENSGNVHLKPKGEIEIKPHIFGIGIGKEKGKITVNEGEGNVLPKSMRRFESIWSKGTVPEAKAKNIVARFFSEFKNEWQNFALGAFEADLFVLFGQTQPQILEDSVNFWIFPWRVILVVLLLTALVIFILIQGIKTYNRWIIKKAQSKL